MFKITLESARVNSGLTQKQASDILGINVKTLSKYEKNSANIPFDLANNLCILYKIPIDNVFFGPKVHYKMDILNKQEA